MVVLGQAIAVLSLVRQQRGFFLIRPQRAFLWSGNSVVVLWSGNNVVVLWLTHSLVVVVPATASCFLVRQLRVFFLHRQQLGCS